MNFFVLSGDGTGRNGLRIFALPVLFCILVLLAVSARSQPSGCSAYSTDIFNVYDESGRLEWDAPDMECVEYFDIAVSTPHGVRHIRGIGDINADTIMPRGGIAAIEAGARASAARFADLGDYKISDVVILMTAVDDEPYELVDPETGRWKDSNPLADANPARPSLTGLCPIRMFTLNDMSSADMEQAIAHELFHCIQFGSLRPDQIKYRTGWWVEGSAMLFTNHVFNNLQPLMKRERKFRRSLEEQVPIYRMNYEAMYPFLWYNEQTGIAGLLPLLRSMPASTSYDAQIAALNAMLAPEQWLQFAKDVDDRKIRYLSHEMADFGEAVDGDIWTIDTTGTQERVLKSFVIMPGWADYECGIWNNRLTPSGANVAVRASDEENWQSWPAETDCRSSGGKRYRMIAMSTHPDNVDNSLRAERRVACENCLGGESEIDQCVVGIWEQTGGGPWAWMKSLGVMPPVTRDNVGMVRMTTRDDGSMFTESLDAAIQITDTDRRGRVSQGDFDGSISPSAGRWSASRGQIRGCFDSGGEGTGVVTARGGDHVISGPWSAPGYAGEAGAVSYRCSATSLRTEMRMPRGGPMWYEFRRVSPPPPGLR